MSWLKQRIRRCEHQRWSRDDNRRVLPFEWGLEHIGGRADERDPRGYLDRWVEHTLARSDDWFAATPADDYRLADGVPTFTSAVQSRKLLWEMRRRCGDTAGPWRVVHWKRKQDACERAQG